MGKFIELKDYDASVHSEILAAVTRDNKKLVEVCQDRAIQKMRGLMSGRYDCDAIFGATGKNRIELVLMYCIDITLYYVFKMHNPQKMTQVRKDSFDEAMEWLEGVRDGIVNIEGAPLLEERTADACPYQMLSNPKRGTRR